MATWIRIQCEKQSLVLCRPPDLHPSSATAGVSSLGKKAMTTCLLCADPFPGMGWEAGHGSHTPDLRASSPTHFAGEETKISGSEVLSSRRHNRGMGTGTLAVAATQTPVLLGIPLHLGPTMCL